MRLKTVREDYEFFTRATGERTRNLAYGRIGAAWALNSAGPTFAPLPLISLICFCAFLALDVFGAVHCAKISKEIILFHEDKAFEIQESCRMTATGIKPFLVQRGSFQGVAKCYD